MKSVIREIHQQLVSGKRSCEELIREKISLISDNEYNTANLLLTESALALAVQVDGKIKAGRPIGLLEGIPFGIEDVILLQGSITTGCSGFLKNYKAPYTATAISKLMEAGAIPVVKENCDSFGHGVTGENSVFGAVRNAHDKYRVAGSSCSGSAVDVAKGYTVFSVAGNTGSAVPAGYNRVYGLKPTYGRVSRYGMMANGSSTDCIGPIASSPEDIRILINTMSGKDAHDRISGSSMPVPENIFEPEHTERQITVGYYRQFIENKYLDATIKTAFQMMIKNLSDKGFRVITLDSFDIDVTVATASVLAMAEASSALARLDGSVYGIRPQSRQVPEGAMIARSENFTDETKRRIIGGSQVLSHVHDHDVYLKAGILKNQLIDAIYNDFEKVNIILSPATVTLPPTFIQSHDIQDIQDIQDMMYLPDVYAAGFHMAGLPTLTAPLFTPTGIQITASKNREDIILSFANYLEEAEKWT